jgi:prepilin-type N-terminal cleavage/methylation domain-containing protein
MEIRTRSELELVRSEQELVRPKQGFSLVEAVIVISILAILAGALVPRVTKRLGFSGDMGRLGYLAMLQAAIYH